MGATFSASAIFRAVDQITAPVRRMTAVTQSFAASASMSFGAVADRSKRLHDRIEGLSSSMLSIKTAIFGTAVFGAAKGIYEMTMKTVEANTAQIRLAERLGMSIQGMKELSYAAKMSDMSTEQFAKSFGRFAKSIGEAKTGTGALTKLLQKSDPALLHQLKNTKSAEQAFMLYASAASKIKDPMVRANFVSQAFGRNAAEINNLMMKGPKGIKAMEAEYRRLAGTNGNATMSLEELEQAHKRMTTAITSVKTSIAMAALPTITKVIEGTTNWIAANRQLLKNQISGVVKGFANALGFVVRHLNVIIPLVKWYAVTLLALKAASMSTNIVTWAMKAAQVASATWLGISTFLTGNLTEAVLANAMATKIALGVERAWIIVQWALNASLWGCPIVWIVAGVAALIIGIILLVKHWKEIVNWVKTSDNVFAKIIRASLYPIIIAFKAIKIAIGWVIDSFKSLINWVSTSDNGFAKFLRSSITSIINAFKIFKTAASWVIDSLKWIWTWIRRIAGFALKPIIALINTFSKGTQKELGVNVNDEEKPVNKDAAILTQKKILETNNNQNVQINIDDNTGRARLSGQLQPMPVTVRNTKGGFSGL
jgi:hypothetical protein